VPLPLAAWENGPVRDVVGILRGVISGNMIISY